MSPKKQQRVPLADAAAQPALNNPFARLAEKLPQDVPQATSLAAVAAAHAPLTSNCTHDGTDMMQQLAYALASLRHPHAFTTRRGRGGKTVTQVDHLESLKHALLPILCSHLRRALGCGGAVEGHTLILQGDQVDGVLAYFHAARK